MAQGKIKNVPNSTLLSKIVDYVHAWLCKWKTHYKVLFTHNILTLK